MSAAFVRQAITCALGLAVLRRKGSRQNPWLDMQRLETESTYLLHLSRAMQRCGSGTVKTQIDTVPGAGFYDFRRVRLQSPLLERCFELVCPDGELVITPAVVDVIGLRGLVGLWLDWGQWSESGAGTIALPRAAGWEHLLPLIEREQIPITLNEGATGMRLRLSPLGMEEFAAAARPLVHRSMRHALRRGSCHGQQLIRRDTPDSLRRQRR